MSRRFYEEFVPRAMHSCRIWNDLRVQIKQVLNQTPKGIDAKIAECFETHGPMTIDMFERAALVYGLPIPEFNDSNKFVSGKKS